MLWEQEKNQKLKSEIYQPLNRAQIRWPYRKLYIYFFWRGFPISLLVAGAQSCCHTFSVKPCSLKQSFDDSPLILSIVTLILKMNPILKILLGWCNLFENVFHCLSIKKIKNVLHCYTWRKQVERMGHSLLSKTYYRLYDIFFL